jgi:hypothetical protein
MTRTPVERKRRASKRQITTPQITHLFQIQLTNTQLSKKQAAQVAAALRRVTSAELLKLDFRIEELTPLFSGGSRAVGSCGGGCRAG